ncbi:unnamed protein product [Mycena citricolor]|uniref:Uncharacterized protein n=1 Tax=Mycena citricolor TaxID=2018698 RepID=A0AAD2Q4S4_9AGAR|nr:unnamed protein product [Mycena citricolor]
MQPSGYYSTKHITFHFSIFIYYTHSSHKMVALRFTSLFLFISSAFVVASPLALRAPVIEKRASIGGIDGTLPGIQANGGSALGQRGGLGGLGGALGGLGGAGAAGGADGAGGAGGLGGALGGLVGAGGAGGLGGALGGLGGAGGAGGLGGALGGLGGAGGAGGAAGAGGGADLGGLLQQIQGAVKRETAPQIARTVSALIARLDEYGVSLEDADKDEATTSKRAADKKKKTGLKKAIGKGKKASPKKAAAKVEDTD